MSSVNIDQVLAQMRVMAAQAGGDQVKPEAPGEAGFGKLLTDSIEQVNASQQHAGELKKAFETGEGNVELAEVMVAIQKSSLYFEEMVQVRNKLVDAYKDIMNMPI